MMWNTDPASHRSVRSPAYFGPCALAAALISVSLLSDPIWKQFHIAEATAANTTMLIGEWGVCTTIRNTTGLIGPAKFCTSTMSGFDVYLNLNDTMYYNFPTPNPNDDGIILGTTQPEGTINQVKIVSSAQTSLVWVHFITALFAISNLVILAIPPRWIGNGKTPLANFQRSGVLNLGITIATFILGLTTFGLYFNMVQGIKRNFNAIPGISATWSGTFIGWFVLASSILYIPPLATVLVPTYIRPKDDDDESAPMAPLVAPQGRYEQMNKSRESVGSFGANSPFPKVPSMYMGRT